MQAEQKSSTQERAQARGRRILLSYHPARKIPLHRLPYFGRIRPDDEPFWNVPARGGYTGGTQTGKALACAYLRYLRETPREIGDTHLQNIVLSMIEASANATASERDALRGQVVGFFELLDLQLRAFLRQSFPNAVPSEQEIISKANAGLTWTKADTAAAIRQWTREARIAQRRETRAPELTYWHVYSTARGPGRGFFYRDPLSPMYGNEAQAKRALERIQAERPEAQARLWKMRVQFDPTNPKDLELREGLLAQMAPLDQ